MKSNHWNDHRSMRGTECVQHCPVPVVYSSPPLRPNSMELRVPKELAGELLFCPGTVPRSARTRGCRFPLLGSWLMREDRTPVPGVPGMPSAIPDVPAVCVDGVLAAVVDIIRSSPIRSRVSTMPGPPCAIMKNINTW